MAANQIWELLGENSGQLGILITLFAVIFAVIQIRIAQKQRSFQLISDYLKDNFNAIQLVEKIEEKIKLTKIEFNEASYIETDDSLIQVYQNNISLIEQIVPSLIEGRTELQKMFDEVHSKKLNISILEIEKSLTARLQILSIVSTCDRQLNEVIIMFRSHAKLQNHIISQKKQIAENEKMLQKMNLDLTSITDNN